MLLGLNNNNKQTNAKITTKPKNLHGKDNVVIILFYQI
jgi:hypothetical protein